MSTTKQPSDKSLSKTYRAGAREEPPAQLDARILAEAERAVGKRRAVRAPFGPQWAMPLSAAAVVVISVGLVVFVAYEAQPPAPPVAEMSTSEILAKEKREPRRDVAPGAQTDRLAEASAPPTASAAAKPAPTTQDSAQFAASSPPPAEVAQRSMAPARKEGYVAADKRMPLSAANSGLAGPVANVVSVKVTGTPGAYEFEITISSADAGCQQYADWWEVVSEDGRLLYRRVLEHSHVNEQPFVRNGVPVPIQADTVVWVRAHMHPAGYGGTAFRGSVRNGFQVATPPASFASELAAQAPHGDCAY